MQADPQVAKENSVHQFSLGQRLELQGDVERPPAESIESVETQWVRARRSGILRLRVPLGARVRRGDVLGAIGEWLELERRCCPWVG